MKKYQLPKEFATKWIEALRSGEYKQGTSYLSAVYTDGVSKMETRYCCLGVACSMVGIPDEALKTEFIKPVFLEDGFSLPIALLGDRSTNQLVKELTTMNDGEKGITPATSFPEIADWIEANVDFI